LFYHNFLNRRRVKLPAEVHSGLDQAPHEYGSSQEENKKLRGQVAVMEIQLIQNSETKTRDNSHIQSLQVCLVSCPTFILLCSCCRPASDFDMFSASIKMLIKIFKSLTGTLQKTPTARETACADKIGSGRGEAQAHGMSSPAKPSGISCQRF
jgi:hypothetical protein